MYKEMTLKLLEECDFKELIEPLNDYKLLLNNINNNILDINLNNNLYNKYKNEIKYLNNIIINVNNNKVNIIDINDKNNSNNILIEFLFKICILRYSKYRLNEYVKFLLVSDDDKLIYEIIMKGAKK